MKTLGRLVVGATLLLGWSHAAATGPVRNGQHLLRACTVATRVMESSHALTPRTPDAYFDTGYCLGLLRGVANMNLLWQQYAKDPSMFFCPPSESTIHEWIPVVVTYLQDHPERLHEEDVLLASVALTRVFPCPPKAQRLRRRTK